MPRTPRTVEELAALVDINNNVTLEDSIKANIWTQNFYDSLQDKDLKLIFIFLVLTVSLQNKEKEKQELALFELQNRVFSNNKTGIPNIRFRDTDNAVEEIFKWDLKYLSLDFISNIFFFSRLYENTKSDKENNKPVGLHTQVQIKADSSTLRQKILSLKQDKTVRNELEPAFQAFIKKPRPFEQCLLSLL